MFLKRWLKNYLPFFARTQLQNQLIFAAIECFDSELALLWDWGSCFFRQQPFYQSLSLLHHLPALTDATAGLHVFCSGSTKDSVSFICDGI